MTAPSAQGRSSPPQSCESRPPVRGGASPDPTVPAAGPPAALAFPRGHCRPGLGTVPRFLTALTLAAVVLGVAQVAYAQTSVLASNTGQTPTSTQTIGAKEQAQPFITGLNIGGYTLTSIELDVQRVPTSTSGITVALWSATGGGLPNAVLHTLTHPSDLSTTGLTTFSAPANTVLTKGTKYFIFVSYDGGGTTLRLKRTNSATALDAASLAGWSTAARRSRNRGSSTGWVIQGGALLFKINGSAADVWSATLTVKDLTGGFFGCSNGDPTVLCSSTSILTDDDFTYDNTPYTVTVIGLLRDQLQIVFDTALTATAVQALALEVDGTPLAFADATPSLAVYTWDDTGLGWSAGDTVALKLIEALPTLSIADAQASEQAGAIAFAVTLSEGATGSVTVAYATADGTATAGADYTRTSGTLTFADGETAQTVSVPVADNADDDGYRSFTVTLSSPSGATLGNATATGTILDDEGAEDAYWHDMRIEDAAAIENNGTLDFQVRLERFAFRDVTVAYATWDGTAIAGEDYTETSGILTIPVQSASETISVPITNDTDDEALRKTFTLTLSNPTHANLIDATATGTILDDDVTVPSNSMPMSVSLASDSGDRDGSVQLDANGRFKVSFVFQDPTDPISGVRPIDFDAGDVTVTNGTKGTMEVPTAQYATSYKLAITPTGDVADVSVSVAAGVAHHPDHATLGNMAVEWNAADPVSTALATAATAGVALTLSVPDAGGAPVALDEAGGFEVRFAFTDADDPDAPVAVTDFTPGDVEVTGGTGGERFAYEGPDGAVYRLRITPDADAEEVTVMVGFGAAQDASDAAVVNAAAGLQVVLARALAPPAAPAATVTSAAEAPVSGAFDVTVRFSTPVTGFDPFDPADLVISNGHVTRGASLSDGTEHTVTVAPAEGATGAITITVPAGVARDAHGTPNAASAPFTIALASGGDAQPVSPVTGFTLFDNANNGQDVQVLTEGVVLEALASNRLNIRADTASGAAIGSVRLELTGTRSSARTENIAPWALFGDRGGEAFPAGAYTVAATPYPEKNLGGTPGSARSVSFTVAAVEITGFTLFDHADGGRDVQALTADAALGAQTSDRLNIRADAAPGAAIGSVRLELSGGVTAANTENGAPWYLFGDRGNRGARAFPAGAYTVTATPYPEANLGGASGQALSVSFTVQAHKLSVADARAEEGTDATIGFTVTLSAVSPAPVTVEYATSDGTATAGVDYTAKSGTLTFPPGETSWTVSVQTTKDTNNEEDETFTLTLSNPANATLGTNTTATGTINDDDGLPTVLDFAHFANGDDTTSDLVFVNLSTEPVRPAIYFYDTEGALVSAESVVEVTGDLVIQEDGGLTVLTEMEPLGELTIPTHGQGELVSGSVKVVANVPIGGMLRFDLPGIGEAVVGASPPVRDALFAVRRREGGINTGVAIHNLEAEAVEVVCELMQEGVLRDAVSLPLEANGQTAWLIDAAFPGADTSDLVGSVHCDAPGRRRFSAVALEVDPGTRIFTTLPVFPVDRRGDGPEAALDFAHFANGDGTTSDLVFVNMKTQPSGPAPTPFHTAIPPIRPAIYFYDTEGNPIAAESVVDVTGDLVIQEDGGLTVLTEMEPLGELTVSTHGQGALVSGSVRVLSNGPIGGMLRYDLPHIGEAVVGASQPVSDAIFAVRRREEGITTGVALHNLESSPALVHCDLLREGVLRDTASFPLEANGQTSWLIDQAFPGADTSDFTGSVRCDAVGEGRFSAVALEMDPGTRIFTTLPVVPLGEMPSQ